MGLKEAFVFEEAVKDLDPAQVFSWTGRFDPEEGAQRLKTAGQSILLSLDGIGGMIADSVAAHDVIAHSIGLPGGKSFRLIRDAMILAKLLEKVNTPGGIQLALTQRGRNAVRHLRVELGEPEIEEPTSDTTEPAENA